MNDIFSAGWFQLMMPALAAFFSLAAAGALLSLIRSNKGARINRAWGLIAFGLALFGLAGLDATLEALALPNASDVRGALTAAGALFAAIGAVHARGIHRGLLK